MAEARDPFVAPAGPVRPAGLARDHWWKGELWFPHADAVRVGTSRPRFMDVDDHIDRYLLRMRDLDRQPGSREWLRWLLDDDAQSQERERIASRKDKPVVDDTGTPTSWSV